MSALPLFLHLRIWFDPEDLARVRQEAEWLQRNYPEGQPHLAAERERQIERIASNWAACALVEVVNDAR